MNTFPWTDEQVAELIKLWREGKSSRECAKLLDPTGNLSRSAVCGKVNRLSLTARPKAERVEQIRRTVRTQTPRIASPRVPPKPTPAPKAAQPVKAPPQLIDVTGFRTVTVMTMSATDCRFDMGGEGADALFCGEPRKGRFCAHHNDVGSQKGLPLAKPPRDARLEVPRPGRLSNTDLKWGRCWP